MKNRRKLQPAHKRYDVINNRRQGKQKRHSKEAPFNCLVVKVVLKHLV